MQLSDEVLFGAFTTKNDSGKTDIEKKSFHPTRYRIEGSPVVSGEK
jgi:hypothetical protein